MTNATETDTKIMANKKSGRTFRIRHCDGNKAAWLLVCLVDGEELSSWGSATTSLTLDGLLANAKHLTPGPDDTVQFVI